MEGLSIGEIASVCGGILKHSGKSFSVRGISTDSRKVNKGDMFIALKGESFDGHDYIDKAIECGAALVVSQKPLERAGVPYILVKDTLKALQDIARYYKKRFTIPFIAVTGSSGKTTTKDMIAAVLSRKYKVLKTEGNLNNAIGLPLTLMKLDYSHEIAVVEMGMNSFGEIRLLSDIVRPDIGVISNVGTAHIEKLGSRENILKAKLELFAYFGGKNTAIINGDNDLLKGFASGRFRVIKFGLDKLNDIYAYDIVEKGEEGIDFTVDFGGKPEWFSVALPGMHNVYNALSAISVAGLFDMSAEEIRNGLMEFKPSKMRMDILNLKSGMKVINDVYNANPDSMVAAINVLLSMKSGTRRVCILGDMLELGDVSAEEHRKVGKFAAESGIDVIAAVGNFSGDIARGAAEGGMDNRNIHKFYTKEEAIASLSEILKPEDVVLVKGSRAMKMEIIIDFLRERG
ncbi:MAG: UDP-N-acetylmuramoyl-tripeptide--D-alanyl-D-alanine ligase [Caulobacteraceae bacterium]